MRRSPEHKPNTKLKEERDADELSNVDHVVTNASSSQLYIFEDNQAAIKMVIKEQKSNVRVQNPQSCVRLVDWQSQLGPLNSKSNMFTPRTDLRTC